MLRLLADENFNSDIVRGLLLRLPNLHIVRAQDIGLTGTEDAEILEWAASNDSIVVTHDRATMPMHASDRIARNQHLPGIFILDHRLPVRTAIEELELIITCTEADEWRDLIVHLPL